MASEMASNCTSANCQVRDYLSHDNFSRLEKIMYLTHVSEGNHLFWEGDTADRIYFVKKGRVKVTKTTEDGKELILYMLQQGDMFGEIGVPEGSVFQYSAEVTQGGIIGIIQQKDLEILVYQHGDFAVEFIKWMGLLQRKTQSKFRDLMLYGKTGALASTLIRLCNSYGSLNEKGIKIMVQLTNTDLANMIGTSRESVNRLLSGYRSEGMLSYEQGHIVVHNLDYFKGICFCPECPSEICRI